jgi:CheY-like chemotaxis protein
MADAKRRILIVDDTDDITTGLKLYLEKVGPYDVRVVREGLQALEAAREFRPDLILLDLVMPDMRGEDVAAQLAADAACRDIRVVFLTAAVSLSESGGRGEEIGGKRVLSKLMGLPEVVKYIKQTLESQGGASRP